MSPGQGNASERRYAGQSPAERAEGRRDALVDAGLELFGTIGLSATTIEDLCQCAGVGRNAFYEHFASRSALLGAVYEVIATEVLTQVDAALFTVADDDLPARAEAGVRAVVDALLGDPRKGRILAREIYLLPPDAALGRRRVHYLADRFLHETQRLVDADVIPAREYGVLVVAAVGAIREVVLDQIERDVPDDVDDVVRALAHLVISMTG